jgi:hypothetical protein
MRFLAEETSATRIAPPVCVRQDTDKTADLKWVLSNIRLLVPR